MSERTCDNCRHSRTEVVREYEDKRFYEYAQTYCWFGPPVYVGRDHEGQTEFEPPKVDSGYSCSYHAPKPAKSILDTRPLEVADV